MEIDAYLSGLYVILGSKDYTVLLWNVLYILLGFLLLTILAMLFLSNRAKVENEKSFTVPSGESRKSAQNRPAVQQIIPAADEAVEAPEPPYDFAEVVLPELESAFPAETFPAPEEVLEEASPFAAETSGFSPVTRLGSPQNFLNRLRFELERAASFDQDLAIAVLDIRGGGGKSDKSRRQLGELVLKHFPFQDLAFEYSPSRFVIIIPEQSKEQALNKVKILGNEAGEMHISLGMGLSARGTRVVDAENLFSEAVDALETGESHAQKQGAVHSGDEADS